LKVLYDAAALLKGVPQQRVTDKAKEITGSNPTLIFTKPKPFASGGTDMQDSGDEPDDQQAPTTHRRSGLPQSIVRYRQLTLVFIKPASGSLERVFLGQLLEPVVEQFAESRDNSRCRSSLVVARPGIRYFRLVVDASEGHLKFQLDGDALTTVNAQAIYGEATYSSSVCSPNGLLNSFEIDSEEMDRMEGIVNEVVSEDSSSEDSNAEEQTEALLRDRAKLRNAKKITGMVGLDPRNVLDSGSVRRRAPTRNFLSEVRYNEVSGRKSSVDSARNSHHFDFL
jgi:hypothetical protein